MYKTRLFSKSKFLEEVLITGPDVFSRYTGPWDIKATFFPQATGSVIVKTPFLGSNDVNDE